MQKNTPSSENTRILIGTIGNDADKLSARFLPLAQHIAEKLSEDNEKFDGHVVIAKNIQEMEQLLMNQEIDLYMDSTLPAYMISKVSNSEVFLQRWKDNTEEYNSVFFVKKDSDILSVDDFSGKTIAGQGIDSTSGYLLPLYHLMKNGFIVDEKDSKSIHFVFTGDDENTGLWVIEGKADIGVSSNIDFKEIPKEIRNELEVIEATEKIPRQVVSHRSELEDEMTEKIRNILLNMNNYSEGQDILEKFKHTTKFSEIKDKDELEKRVFGILEKVG